MNSPISKSILVFLVVVISFSSLKSYLFENNRREFKYDLIELSDIKYGMFNVDKWKDQFASIITKKLKEIDLSGKDREIAREKIETFLYESIENFESDYKSNNEKKSILGFSVKNIGADFFSIFQDLKQRVPLITEDILNFLEKEENREKIKSYILLQLNKYRDSTFQKIDYGKFKNIEAKYQAKDEEDCKGIINNRIENIDSKLTVYNLLIFFSYLLFLLNIMLVKKHSNFTILLYILAAFHLLLLGVFLPMIDIDARIGSMEFTLLGESISFEDQILYYKSKSIVEMSQIMLTQEKFQVMVVGILVLIFSVIFPVSKLVSSLFLISKRSLRQNRIVNFLVFKSGKWSMADVMVVAIFMAYIGFSGIISSQLNQIEKISPNLNILTTNNSELQNGFYFFLGFVILGISISQKIMDQFKSNEPEEK